MSKRLVIHQAAQGTPQDISARWAIASQSGMPPTLSISSEDIETDLPTMGDRCIKEHFDYATTEESACWRWTPWAVQEVTVYPVLTPMDDNIYQETVIVTCAWDASLENDNPWHEVN